MGPRLISTIFSCLLVIGITLATDVPAGSNCPDTSSNDACVANTVCDKVHGKCLLKVGQACTGTNEHNCVFGAFCGAANCECGGGYAVKNDICEPTNDGTVGFDCSSDHDLCTTPNSECSDLGACKCKTGFLINVANGQCDGDVGTTCTSGDTCVASSVCDNVVGTCLLKADQSCTAGKERFCISGASCEASGCTCGAGYTKHSDNTCEPKTAGTVGSDCTSGVSACTTANSECSDLKACKCKNGFLPNITNGQCDGDVGTTCTSGDTCVASSVCDNVVGTCLLKADQSCTAGKERFCISGASCEASGCTCGAGYTKHSDNTCEPKTAGTVGSDCTSGVSACTTANSECSDLKACKCKNGFLPNITNGQCDGDVGTTCTSGDTCVASSVCDNVVGTCLLKADQSCTAGKERFCISGASCEASGCTCGAGYTKHSDNTCEPKTAGTVGSDCTSGVSACTTANSECSDLKACKCKNGFLPNITNGQCDGDVGTTCTSGDTCVASSVCDNVAEKCSIIHGESCPSNTDNCVSNAACVDNACKCDATKTISSTTGLCLLRAGQACTVKSYCVVGAACQSLTCQCSGNFVENSTTKLCEIKHGMSCADNQNNCVPHAACVSDVCQCDVGTTVADPSGLCTLKNIGSNSAKLSSWLLIAALMSMSHAHYAV